MEEKLRAHINGLFAGAVLTRRTTELKEEMAQNLIEKYQDLIDGGIPPEEAYGIAVSGIGDIGTLLSSLEQDDPNSEFFVAQKNRSALFTAVAVMLYILSVLPLVVTQIIFPNRFTLMVSLSIMFVAIAGATGLLVYNNMSKIKPPAPVLTHEQWLARRRERNRQHGMISSAFWIGLVIFYFIVSFATRWWHLTWMLFLVGGLVETMMSLSFSKKNGEWPEL